MKVPASPTGQTTSQPGQLRDGSLASRHRAAGPLLVLVILVPLLATINRDQSQYQAVTLLAALFVLVMLPEAWKELRTLLRTPLVRAGVWAAAILVLGWTLLSLEVWRNERALFYLVLLPFYSAAVAWFRIEPERRLRAAVLAKISITALAAAWIAIWGYHYDLEGRPDLIYRWTPIYLHFRHVNPDVFYALALIACLWPESLGMRAMLALALLPLGYFSIWSGGRAEFLALAVFAGLLIGFGAIRRPERRLLLPCLFFVLGSALVFALGQDRYVAQIFGRTVNASADIVTSGRWPIWKQSLVRVTSDAETLLFGFGPDAYQNIGIANDMTAITGFVNPTSHPHDTVVLWLLEFGLVGTIPLLLIMAAVLRRSFDVLRTGSMLDFRTGTAALIISTVLFSLLDCQFYYAVPLMFFLILAAFQKATSSSA